MKKVSLLLALLCVAAPAIAGRNDKKHIDYHESDEERQSFEYEEQYYEKNVLKNNTNKFDRKNNRLSQRLALHIARDKKAKAREIENEE